VKDTEVIQTELERQKYHDCETFIVNAERTRIVGLFDALAKTIRESHITNLQLIHVKMWRIIEGLRK
jgi:hypothetical protein